MALVVPLRDQERVAVSRESILQSARAYDFEAFHEFIVAAYGYDVSLVSNVEDTLLVANLILVVATVCQDVGADLNLVPLRHADLQASAEVSRIW